MVKSHLLAFHVVARLPERVTMVREQSVLGALVALGVLFVGVPQGCHFLSHYHEKAEVFVMQILQLCSIYQGLCLVCGGRVQGYHFLGHYLS